MSKKENIFMNQLMAKLPPEIDGLPYEEKMNYFCEVYKEFDNRLTRWCGDDREEFHDLEETVDVLREIVMFSLMEQNGYIKDENTELWQKQI